MNTNEKNLFAAAMAGIAELHSKKLSKHLLNLYWDALKDYPFDVINIALERHLKSPDIGQFMPKPADIIRCLIGDSKTQALRAWTLVIKAIREIGLYTTVVFDDPLIHIAIEDMGGWIRLCQSTENELPFRGKEFENRYCGYVLQPPTYYPKQLWGLIDQHNLPLGLEVSCLKLIGDETRAKQVYATGQTRSGLYVEVSPQQLLSIPFESTKEENHDYS